MALASGRPRRRVCAPQEGVSRRPAGESARRRTGRRGGAASQRAGQHPAGAADRPFAQANAASSQGRPSGPVTGGGGAPAARPEGACPPSFLGAVQARSKTPESAAFSGHFRSQQRGWASAAGRAAAPRERSDRWRPAQAGREGNVAGQIERPAR